MKTPDAHIHHSTRQQQFITCQFHSHLQTLANTLSQGERKLFSGRKNGSQIILAWRKADTLLKIFYETVFISRRLTSFLQSSFIIFFLFCNQSCLHSTLIYIFFLLTKIGRRSDFDLNHFCASFSETARTFWRKAKNLHPR